MLSYITLYIIMYVFGLLQVIAREFRRQAGNDGGGPDGSRAGQKACAVLDRDGGFT
jgi:hypothetical protein